MKRRRVDEMEYFSGHVISGSRNPEFERGLMAGVSCIVCRKAFEAIEWPRNGIQFECACPCVCSVLDLAA